MTSPSPPSSPNHSVAARFAIFLCAQREPNTARWVEAVRQHPGVKTAVHIHDEDLKDHLPKLFEDLAGILRGEPVSDQAQEDAEAHGEHRWQQRYSLEEVLKELGIVSRMVLRHGLDAFEEARPEIPEKRNPPNA